MRYHLWYEGRDEYEMYCRVCGCSFFVSDPECDDSEWDAHMSAWGIDQDCDVQLASQILDS
jgi:hypothetical protein